MVGGLTSLTTLHLRCFEIATGAALSAIAALPPLTSLRLRGVQELEHDPPRLHCMPS